MLLISENILGSLMFWSRFGHTGSNNFIKHSIIRILERLLYSRIPPTFDLIKMSKNNATHDWGLKAA